MRWGIETSFRSLKYSVGLIHLHAKKPDLVLQEISPVFSSSTSENYSLSAPVEPRQGLKSRATAFPPAAPPHAEPLFTLLFQTEFPPSGFAVYFFSPLIPFALFCPPRPLAGVLVRQLNDITQLETQYQPVLGAEIMLYLRLIVIIDGRWGVV